MVHRARKRFGQNFLHDPHVIDRIIRAILPTREDHLVEIGPGQGAITGQLLAMTDKLDAVELDRDLVTMLGNKYADYPEFRLHSGDALKFDFCQLAAAGEKLRIIGNLPYNISTPLLFHLLENAQCLQDMHFMLQKEVVERMAAEPGSKTYGRLSVMLQAYCQVQMLFPIGPGAFLPPPKVESAFVRLIPYQNPPFPIDHPERFAQLVSLAFSQRRKTLRNTLKGQVSPEAMENCGIDPGSRAEQLGVEQFACLSNLAH
ncbi:MAG TPA: 16S rRNA (adenine(1518)-N(6)/adenine(1519)-N(6))-dimethyltransferase RsmA [Thiolapillus brandeum]|uniref:Ribosomal RNA small subunit methyltransferase A n=1 Tax=Thiolapillus brandeum TaxID=1076588 RepID=A0A831KBM4_9GAMM|nr:16S rRNA (adenine(1518)-N(6)/adenine(1519)-N(6))-dimethyltransferase RsmA [Thiolapillus brandeum]